MKNECKNRILIEFCFSLTSSIPCVMICGLIYRGGFVLMATVLSIVLIIAALFMIVSVLMQSSEEGGISAITGQSNSYLSKSKAKTFEAKLALCTKIAAVVFVVLSLLMLIIK